MNIFVTVAICSCCCPTVLVATVVLLSLSFYNNEQKFINKMSPAGLETNNVKRTQQRTNNKCQSYGIYHGTHISYKHMLKCSIAKNANGNQAARNVHRENVALLRRCILWPVQFTDMVNDKQ